MKYILSLQDPLARDPSVTGGKGATLAELIRGLFSVPSGFVFTIEAHKTFSKQGIPREIQQEVLQKFDDLNVDKVAVRSSASVEDQKGASWAGQFETYLNTSRDRLIERIEDCWKSVESERAKSYAKASGIDPRDISIAVVIQKMIQANVSGVCFTLHPNAQNRNQLVVEAISGLGEALVQGAVTPDTYIVDRESMELTDIKINPRGTTQKLLDDQIQNLSRICIDIEKHFKYPQDIEWVLENGDFYIVQSRPITTIED
ncbi:MAG: hypothetical protein A2119_01210 [Candidatus Colwellbacteria bacterium GWA2_46_10]|uniref:Phosphoenolpyruvate synthase n=1 Tax=Candidatus Colwellbacteria bacterium GWA2_46_10 TaxID=1797684 RepID=A0A1G1YX79_9BACT|nr:MAG: hypothetical protein A2119_01210 [Candidatus Colwellbacteria bacterium GWA2_46_10]